MQWLALVGDTTSESPHLLGGKVGISPLPQVKQQGTRRPRTKKKVNTSCKSRVRSVLGQVLCPASVLSYLQHLTSEVRKEAQSSLPQPHPSASSNYRDALICAFAFKTIPSTFWLRVPSDICGDVNSETYEH